MGRGKDVGLRYSLKAPDGLVGEGRAGGFEKLAEGGALSRRWADEVLKTMGVFLLKRK